MLSKEEYRQNRWGLCVRRAETSRKKPKERRPAQVVNAMLKQKSLWRWSVTLKAITDELIEALSPLTFSEPVTHVYNPLIYARPAWDQYCEKYGQGTRRVLALGMNPGPFGMSMTNQGGRS